MTRSISALAALLLVAGCITITPRSQTAGASAVVIPDVPIQKWGIESCGAGSLSTVLQHYGDTTSMASWDAALPKTRGGVMTVDLLIAARQKGFQANLVTGTPETVSAELAAGRPVILMLQVVDSPGHHYDFFHYIVLDGIDPSSGLVRTQFGDTHPRWVSFGRLEKAWNGGGHAAIFIRPLTEEEGLRAAVALEAEGKTADAAVAYRRLLTRNDHNPILWTNLGNAEVQLGDDSAAETDFRRALDVDPNFRDALNNVAWLLYRQKRLPEAETYARRAVAQNGPDLDLVLDTLGRVLAAKGDCEEAHAVFQRAIAAVPDSRSASRADLEKAMTDADRSCTPRSASLR